MITFQLLGKDGSSLDDAEVLSGRWHSYVKGFVSDAETPGMQDPLSTHLTLDMLTTEPSLATIDILTSSHLAQSWLSRDSQRHGRSRYDCYYVCPMPLFLILRFGYALNSLLPKAVA
jgi:hypothetical protein